VYESLVEDALQQVVLLRDGSGGTICDTGHPSPESAISNWKVALTRFSEAIEGQFRAQIYGPSKNNGLDSYPKYVST
jgi:hypothetical protein